MKQQQAVAQAEARSSRQSCVTWRQAVMCFVMTRQSSSS